MTVVEQIRQFLTFVHPPGSRFEIRGLGSKGHGTMRLLTANALLAARSAVKMSAMGADVYFTLNPINPVSKYAQRTKIDYPVLHARGTASDADILARWLYLIDIDPVRPTGTASTDDQLVAAIETADRVEVYLTSLGWSKPIRLLSGNGIHLLYRGDGCAAHGKEATEVVRDALRYLADEFNGICKVDTAVHNAARISRLPFTLNKKAQRISTVLSYPEKFEPIMAGKVYQLSRKGGAKTGHSGARISSSTSKRELLIDEDGVEDLIDEYSEILQLDSVSVKGDATYFGLEICPFKGEAHRGQDVGAGKTAIILRPNSIGFKCFSDDCADRTFVDLLRLLHEETGQWPDTKIWADPDDSALEARWGGVEDLTHPCAGL